MEPTGAVPGAGGPIPPPTKPASLSPIFDVWPKFGPRDPRQNREEQRAIQERTSNLAVGELVLPRPD